MPLGTITFRCDAKLAAELWECVKRKLRSRGAPQTYSVSDFIRDAIVEKIEHIERSRKSAEKRRDTKSRIKPADYSGYHPVVAVDDSSDVTRDKEV